MIVSNVLLIAGSPKVQKFISIEGKRNESEGYQKKGREECRSKRYPFRNIAGNNFNEIGM